MQAPKSKPSTGKTITSPMKEQNSSSNPTSTKRKGK